MVLEERETNRSTESKRNSRNRHEDMPMFNKGIKNNSVKKRKPFQQMFLESQYIPRRKINLYISHHVQKLIQNGSHV